MLTMKTLMQMATTPFHRHPAPKRTSETLRIRKQVLGMERNCPAAGWRGEIGGLRANETFLIDVDVEVLVVLVMTTRMRMNEKMT